MPPLAPELRRDLEKAVVTARRLAESAARAALARLGVEDAEAPAGLSPELRGLRTALRERAKALGGGVRVLGIPLLVEEIAYEQWHRMLFARFLAENELLLHPEGAPVSLTEVRELAAEEGERDPWVLAARYAAAMLPGIFRADDPANRVALAPEDRSRLEAVLEGLPASVFTADDALGWVYQFWQSERKKEVNKRGDKIGGADLPPVTQLFTEHYMVRFLLENSLGAWWAGRHPDSPLLREWEYLRFRDEGTPAAGTFEGWPSRVAEVTVMDPCCGSGHFLVAAADMLRRMRMEEERLTAAQAAVAVLRDNLFGLELDARCVQLAAFNLALDAWKAGGYQPLPVPNLACTGIAIKGQRAGWHRFAGGDTKMVQALDRLYDLFQDAPELGSLIDPRAAAGEGLWAVDVADLLAKLDQALQREAATDPAAAVFGAAAAGTAKAAQLLARRYWFVATNPPFLGIKKRLIVERAGAPSAASYDFPDLAFEMLLRWLTGLHATGATAFVLPQSLTAHPGCAGVRAALRTSTSVRLLAQLGSRAFEAVGGHVVAVVLLVASTGRARWPTYSALDVSGRASPALKNAALRSDLVAVVSHPTTVHAPIDFSSLGPGSGRLDLYADSVTGIMLGDAPRWSRFHFELPPDRHGWRRVETAPERKADKSPFTGKTMLVRWENNGTNLQSVSALSRMHGRHGVLVTRADQVRASIWTGAPAEQSGGLLLPKKVDDLSTLWAFVRSTEYATSLRAAAPRLIRTTSDLLRVPFDLEHWQELAAEQYPHGLPEPHSDDPTQWLFKGNVVGSEAPLQVAVARLLGYRWPDQEPDALDELADADGLVPLVSVGGERPAAERLRTLLARADGDAWSPALLERLLAEAGSPGQTLETWLRDDFFAQHAKLFHQRPFIWHVWDGRKDGFSVLCHYHRLDRAKLEKLTYTLLGDWIERQRAAGDEPGAEARLAAALGLQENLARILEGEAPFDIYVRWKSLAEQPIGWEPDLDDGVRLNIRPFVTAGVLRAKVKVKWDKDRGKNPDGSERINDLHPTLAEKRAARAAALKG
ncbi:MAG: DNA methyltransferase [Candidatus Limnocylindrales bacterium]